MQQRKIQKERCNKERLTRPLQKYTGFPAPTQIYVALLLARKIQQRKNATQKDATKKDALEKDVTNKDA